MKIQFKVCTLLLFFTLIADVYAAKIGLLVMATGKYIQFVEPLIKGADKYFFKGHDVTYFIFTDGDAPQHQNIVKIFQKRLGWPYDTLMRPVIYYESRELLCSMDYLFACDADMEFVGDIGEEILAPLIGTLHPGYFGTKGTPDHNPLSTAYITPGANKYYFCGGFNGGSSQEYLKLCEVISKNILTDLEKNIIAVWHDESHINRYFFDHSPKVLSPSYCFVDWYVDKWGTKYSPKLVALVKSHDSLRD